MNGKVFGIGAALFMAGIVLILVSVSINPTLHGTEYFSSKGNVQHINGVYAITIPDNLTDTATSSITIGYNGSINHFALIRTVNLGIINSSDYSTYNVSNASLSQNQISYGNLPVGNYTFIETQNVSAAFFVTHVGEIEAAGYTGTSGLYLAFIGFMSMIVGLVMRNRYRD